MIEIKAEGSTIKIFDSGDITVVPKSCDYAKEDLENTIKEVQTLSAEWVSKIKGEWVLFKNGEKVINFTKRINELEHEIAMITLILNTCRQIDQTPVSVLTKIERILGGE